MRAIIAIPPIISGAALIMYCGAWIAYDRLVLWYLFPPSLFQNFIGALLGAYFLLTGAGILAYIRHDPAIPNDPAPAQSPATSTPAPPPASLNLSGIEARVSKNLEPLIAAGFEKLESKLKDQIIAAGLAPPDKKSSVPIPPEATVDV